jgi:hypothetical protein
VAGNLTSDADSRESEREPYVRAGRSELYGQKEPPTRDSELLKTEELPSYLPDLSRQSKAAEDRYLSDDSEKRISHYLETGDDSDDASAGTGSNEENSMDGDEIA